MTAETWWGKLFSFSQERRIIAVAAIIGLAQGLNSLTDLPTNYLYKDDYGLNPAQLSSISSFVTFPFIIKPIWGYISDHWNFFGYKRKSYLMLFGLLGFLSYMCLGSFETTLAMGMLLLVLINLVYAFNSVVGEALLVESAQRFGALPGKTEDEKQAEASNNISIFFGFKYFGVLVSVYTGGLLLEYITKQQVFKYASLFPLLVGLAAFTLPEKSRFQRMAESPARIPDDEESSQLINRNRPASEASSAPLRYEENSLQKLWKFLKMPEIYKPLIFIFAFQVTPSTSSAMFFFYTDELGFNPEFMGQLKLASAIAILLGIFIYNRFLKNVEFRKILFSTSIICFFLSLLQLVLITRLNVKLGISDKLFCLGDSVIVQVFGELNSFPILVLACRLCPKNIEATVYALFLSVLNFGSILSGQLGALFIWLLGITETDLSNLWIASLISAVWILFPLPWLYIVNFDRAIEKTEKHQEQQAVAPETQERGSHQSQAPVALGQDMVYVENEFKETSIKNI